MTSPLHPTTPAVWTTAGDTAPLPGLGEAHASLAKHMPSWNAAGLPSDDLGDLPFHLGDAELGTTECVKARPAPDDVLNALVILRIHCAMSETKTEILFPTRGLLTALVVRLAEDQKRVAQVLSDIFLMPLGPDTPVIITEGVNLRDTRSAQNFVEKIESTLLRGKSVIAILSDPSLLPNAVQDLVMAEVALPPLNQPMLAAMLGFLHPGQDVQLPSMAALLPRLSTLALVPVFAAATLDEAIAFLNRIIARPARGPDHGVRHQSRAKDRGHLRVWPNIELGVPGHTGSHGAGGAARTGGRPTSNSR